eukprot:4751708-Pyramimonas_sp.AAC.1
MPPPLRLAPDRGWSGPPQPASANACADDDRCSPERGGIGHTKARTPPSPKVASRQDPSKT